MRVGEALIGEGLVTPEQLDAGLRMQQSYGGRIASTLVELGYVEGDAATRTLAKLRKVPAALQKHFDAAERAVIAKIPRRIAEKYMAMPIGWAGEGTLICAMVEPTDLLALEELRFLTGAKVVPGIALEIRVRKALERWYGVTPHDHGFVAASGAGGALEMEQTSHVVPPSSRPAPAQPYRPVSVDLDLTIETPFRAPSSEPPPRAVTARPELTLDPPLRSPITEPELRASRPMPPPVSRPPSSAPRRTHPPPLRRDDPDEEVRPSIRPLGSAQILSFDAALAGIGQGRTLDARIDLLIGWMRSTFEAGAVFEVRNDIAFTSRAFGPSVRPGAAPRVAVPLTQPSMLVLPYEARSTFFGTPPPEGAELHERLWSALGTSAPREALALPIVMEDRVTAIVYAHPRKGERIPPAILVEAANLCAAAGRTPSVGM